MWLLAEISDRFITLRHLTIPTCWKNCRHYATGSHDEWRTEELKPYLLRLGFIAADGGSAAAVLKGGRRGNDILKFYCQLITVLPIRFFVGGRPSVVGRGAYERQPL